MTEDEKDGFAENLAVRAIEAVGPEEAPGLLWGALLSAHLRHHSLTFAVICIEHGLEDLKRTLAAVASAKGTIQ